MASLGHNELKSELSYVTHCSALLVPVFRFNPLRQRQNDHHFADDIFKGIFFNENVWILIIISPQFVHQGSIGNTVKPLTSSHPKCWSKVASQKGWPVIRMLHLLCDFQCPPHPWPWPWIFKVKFWKCCISGMEGPIDMEQKRCESIGCYTHFVTFNIPLTHDLDLGFSRSNFENAVSQEWKGRLTWNKSDVNR